MRARAGDFDAAARCELALLGIRNATAEQIAGAVLRSWLAADIRALRDAYVEEG